MKISTSVQQRATAFNQRGAVLVVSLVLLLIMTILGVAAIRKNLGQEKMAGAAMERNVTLQQADAARTDAQQWLRQRITWPTPNNAALSPIWLRNGPTTFIGAPVSQWVDANWSNAAFWQYGGQTGATLALLAATTPPSYTTEEWANPIDNEVEVEKKDKGMSTFFYRTSSHARGPTDNARVTIRSIDVYQFK